MSRCVERVRTFGVSSGTPQVAYKVSRKAFRAAAPVGSFADRPAVTGPKPETLIRDALDVLKLNFLTGEFQCQ